MPIEREAFVSRVAIPRAFACMAVGCRGGKALQSCVAGRICELSDEIRADPFLGPLAPAGQALDPKDLAPCVGLPRSPSAQPPAAVSAVIGFMTRDGRG